MIKITRSNLSSIILTYKDGDKTTPGIKDMIEDRVKFLQLLIEVHLGTKSFSDIVAHAGMHSKTKNAIINVFKPKNQRKKDLPKTGKFKFQSTFVHILNDLGKLLVFLSDVKNLEKLITGKPDQLLVLEDKLKTKVLALPGYYQELIFVVKLIIAYDDFKTKGGKYINAYGLADLLKVNTCPYCNRQYTFTVIEGKDITRPEFDHFFSQSEHPLLALSFYNLIPSCHICNATLKGSLKSSVKLLHPYFEGFDNNVLFVYKFTQLKPDLSDPENFQLDLKNGARGSKKIAAANNIEVFKLKEIYTQHLDHLGEIYFKCRSFDDAYVKDFFSKFPGMKGKTKAHDIYRFYFGNYLDNEDLDKRILAKFTSDIVKTFKLKF